MRKRLNKEKLRHEKEKLQGRIWAYAELGMKKEAIKGCRELIMLDKDDPQAYMELGVTHADGGDIEKAIRCYKFAIELFPGYSRYYVNLGHIFERHKKRDDIAMICYEKALELDSDDEWALNNVGAVLTKEGRWEEGLLYYKKAYDTCKKKYGFVRGHIVHNLAWALYRCKRYVRSWLIYSYLVNECPGNTDILSDFGCVNYKMGKYNTAFNCFERALSIDPDNKQYHRLFRVVKKAA